MSFNMSTSHRPWLLITCVMIVMVLAVACAVKKFTMTAEDVNIRQPQLIEVPK